MNEKDGDTNVTHNMLSTAVKGNNHFPCDDRSIIV